MFKGSFVSTLDTALERWEHFWTGLKKTSTRDAMSTKSTIRLQMRANGSLRNFWRRISTKPKSQSS